MAFQVKEELQVEVKNEPGALACLLRVVATGGIDVRAFVAYAMGPELGFVHFLPSDIRKAKAALKKAGLRRVQTNKVVAGPIPDRRGEAARIAEHVALHGINLDAAYVTGTGKGKGLLVLSTTEKKDVAKLAKVLS
ncbi:MAG: hypothetical protein HY720_22410 [Planctomycetes bacterium]|nr:hypothetical protein [Planctomycetota bacterium]